MEGMLRETETAAQALRLHLQMVPALSPADLEGAFLTMTREHADAVILLPSPMLYGEHKRIVELAAKSRLPAMYAARGVVEDGGLVSYGASLPDLFRRAATLLNKRSGCFVLRPFGLTCTFRLPQRVHTKRRGVPR